MLLKALFLSRHQFVGLVLSGFFFFLYSYLFFADQYKGNIYFERFSALLMYLHFLHAENIIHDKRSYLREMRIGVFLFCITFHSVFVVVSDANCR